MDVVIVNAATVSWILELPAGWQRVIVVGVWACAIPLVTLGTTSHRCSFNDRRVRGMDERHTREERLGGQGVHERRKRMRGGQRGRVGGVCGLSGVLSLVAGTFWGRVVGVLWGARLAGQKLVLLVAAEGDGVLGVVDVKGALGGDGELFFVAPVEHLAVVLHGGRG